MVKLFDLKNFLRYELSGWKNCEILGLGLVFAIIFTTSLINKDTPIAIIYAICGILYTCIAGKGKISCYFFGIISSICYSLLAFKNALWGNLALNLFYYLPMQVVGVFNWKKHLKKDTKEIIKTSLDKKDLFKLIIISVLSCVLGILILSVLGDKNPVFDGITTVLSIFGMYLTVKRCIEQWFVWMIVNGLSVLMWIDLVLKGSRTFAAVIVWSVYFILALYFFWVWKKEMMLSCSEKSEKIS